MENSQETDLFSLLISWTILKGEDSVEAAITKVRDYLKDNGIENPNIYPASALTALNIRTILANSDDDNDDDVYEAKVKYVNLTGMKKCTLKNMPH